MIEPGSRYATTSTVEVELADGQRVRLLSLRGRVTTTGHTQLVVAPGERLDHLAAEHYGDPTAFWRICDASDQLDPFDVLVPGRPVRIPPAP